jgi:methylated-DNA-[protein]-cysteine S-methyltransferase
MLVQKTLPSPIGPVRLVADDDALVAACFVDQHDAPGARDVDHHPVLDLAAAELEAYFGGARTPFTTPLRSAGTPFQEAVWAALRTIPYGVRWSYTDLARAVGSETATRAVGGANGRNRLAIFLPCHRVIAADGTLGGYAGGLRVKAWLLDLERGFPQGGLFGKAAPERSPL